MSGGRRATRREAIAIARTIPLARGSPRRGAHLQPDLPVGIHHRPEPLRGSRDAHLRGGGKRAGTTGVARPNAKVEPEKVLPGRQFWQCLSQHYRTCWRSTPPRVSRAGFALFVHAFFRRQIERSRSKFVGRKVPAPVHLARSECDTPLTTIRTPPYARPPTAPPLHVRRTRRSPSRRGRRPSRRAPRAVASRRRSPRG